MRIKLIANPRKDWAKALANEVAAALKREHQIVRKGADATICIGGDGTILYAHHKGRTEGIILGIGSEKSYICQLHSKNWKERLLPLLKEGKTIKIMAIECTLGGKTITALNDFLVHATHYRVAELMADYPGGHSEFEGDGLIISSALGSAAYAYSAGGAKLAPTERKISLVPICPYKRALMPKVFDNDASISVRVGSDCAFIVDGIYVRKLRTGERIEARKGKDMIFFSGVGNQ
jgi:NAD+ kinase